MQECKPEASKVVSFAILAENTFGHVCPAKFQISLRIHAVWSESSLGAFWIAKGAKLFYADNKDIN